MVQNFKQASPAVHHFNFLLRISNTADALGNLSARRRHRFTQQHHLLNYPIGQHQLPVERLPDGWRSLPNFPRIPHLRFVHNHADWHARLLGSFLSCFGFLFTHRLVCLLDSSNDDERIRCFNSRFFGGDFAV